jgi:hypothetical protein
LEPTATTSLLQGTATNWNIMEGSLVPNKKKKHAIPACLTTLDRLKNSNGNHIQILFKN